MNIRIKLISILVVFCTLLSVALSLVYFMTAKITLTKEVLNRLDSVATIQRNRIENQVEHNIERLRLVASRTQLRITLKKYMANPQPDYIEKILRILNDAKKSIPSFIRITLLDLNGKEVISTRPNRLVDTTISSELLASSKIRFSADTILLRENQHLQLYLSGPLLLDQELIGIILIESDAERIVSSIKDYTGLGLTGESMLVKRLNNDQALYLTPLRFDKIAALTRITSLQDHNSPISIAILSGRQQIPEAQDYRGQAVFAAARMVRNTGWNLIVKMDKKEAYSPASNLIKFFSLVLLIVFIIIVGISFWFSRSLAKPILALTNTARAIHAGNYHSRVRVSSNDEIGQLASVFNTMTDSIVEKNNALNAANTELQAQIDVRLSAEKTLQLQKRRNELVLSTSQDGFWVMDLDGNIKEVNEAYCQLLGYSHDQLTTMNIREIHDNNNLLQITSWLDNIILKGYYQCETRQRKADMKYLDLEVSASFATIENEPFVFAFARNITDRKRIEVELAQYRDHLEELVASRTSRIKEQAQLLEQIHDSIIVTDMEGIVTSWNHGAERQFGYSSTESIGQHISFIYPTADHQFLQNNIVNPLKQHGEHEIEVTLLKSNGKEFFATLSLSVLYNDEGSPKGIISYALDITERRKSESLYQHKSEALKAAYKELESFSYSVSHDLRAPLRSIDGFSLALLDDYDSLLDETGKDYLYRVRKASQHMGNLIDDMLLLSRVTRKNISYNDINLSDMANEIATTLNQINEPYKVKFIVANSITAYADANLIHIVLDNLLGNAWKYTRKKSHPRAEFGTYVDNGQTIYYVKDNGDGFDMKYVGKLFTAFQRLHKADEFEGTGIGLATVARIIKRHGGKVWAKSIKHEETTVYFTLQNRQTDMRYKDTHLSKVHQTNSA